MVTNQGSERAGGQLGRARARGFTAWGPDAALETAARAEKNDEATTVALERSQNK